MLKKPLLLIPIAVLLAGCNIGGSVDGDGNSTFISNSVANSSTTKGGGGGGKSNTTYNYDEIPGSDGNNPYVNTDVTSTSQSYDDVSSGNVSVEVNTNTGDISVDNDNASAVTDLSQDGISFADGVFTISKAGSYTFSGSIEARIYIEAGDDDEVELVLKGFTLKNSTNSPIFCMNADELKIKLQKGYTNYIYDTRAAESVEDDSQGGGAIYSKCDTKFSGKGSLMVTGNYNNGIHCTKDLKFGCTVEADSSIQVNARNIAIKGNDQVEIESGNIVAIATGGEGIKTADSDVSSKGNQRGDIIISGGHIDIYSCQDAIEAAHDIIIQNGVDEDSGETTIPSINIKTSNYSSYSGEVVSTNASKLYLRTKTKLSTSSKYVLLVKKSDASEVWVDAKYDNAYTSGRSTYYYYEVDMPSTAASFKVYVFGSTVTEYDANSASQAMKDYVNVNSSYDTLTISSYGNQISDGGWSSYTTSSSGGGGQPGGGGPGGGGPGGGMQEGNSEKADYSAKGIKADNIINISGGVINVKAYDDAIHANYGETLENGATGLGDVVISGGKLELYASDDAIHADRYLTINGGSINVTNSYEGLEGNIITIAGGSTYVYATDDGLNAANKAGLTPKIEVKGGLIDTTVYGGDVDAIDSNGSFAQSGGIVITKGGSGQMSTGLDCDGTATVSGGSFVCFGKPEKTPSTSGNVKSSTKSVSVKVGSATVTIDGTDYVTPTKYSYSTVYIYSDTTVTIK